MIFDTLHNVLEARKDWAIAQSRLAEARNETGMKVYPSAQEQLDAAMKAEEADRDYRNALDDFWRQVSLVADDAVAWEASNA